MALHKFLTWNGNGNVFHFYFTFFYFMAGMWREQSKCKRKEFNDMKSDVFLLAEGSSCFFH